MSTAVSERQQPSAKLLVVEDEPNILELLAASLRYAGFDGAAAGDGPTRSRRPSGTGLI